MKKNGFVFIESLTVLLVVALSLVLLISSYSLTVRKSKENEFYDLPSDKYLLYIIGNLGDSKKPFNTKGSFVVDKNTCNSEFNQRITDCASVFDDNNMVKFSIIYNLNNELRNGNLTRTYDSGTIEYLKTLKRCNDNTINTCNDPINYAVGVFYRNNKYYYASLEITSGSSDVTSYTCSAGEYLSKNSTSCAVCLENKYCPGVSDVPFSETEDQGIESCPTGYASTSGSTNITDCKITCSANTYLANANDASCTSCESGNPSNEHQVSYGNISTCGNSYHCNNNSHTLNETTLKCQYNPTKTYTCRKAATSTTTASGSCDCYLKVDGGNYLTILDCGSGALTCSATCSQYGLGVWEDHCTRTTTYSCASVGGQICNTSYCCFWNKPGCTYSDIGYTGFTVSNTNYTCPSGGTYNSTTQKCEYDAIHD